MRSLSKNMKTRCLVSIARSVAPLAPRRKPTWGGGGGGEVGGEDEVGGGRWGVGMGREVGEGQCKRAG